MKVADRVTGIVIMVLSVYGYIYSKNLKGDAGVLPSIIFAAMFIGAVALFVSSFSKKHAEEIEKMNWQKWFIAVGTAILYVAMMNIVGFYIASALYLIGTMFYFGVHNVKTLVLVPVVFDMLIWVCFGLILGISLPTPFFM